MIKAKHIERVELLYFNEIDNEAQKDYSCYEESQFFNYRGLVYCLSEAMRINDNVWHGGIGLTNTCGLVIRLCKDNDYLIVGLNY